MLNNEARSTAVETARKFLGQKPVFFDTETTGTKELDVIVEVSVVDWEGSTLFDTLVKPNRPIPPDAARVHGITDAKVVWSPPWSQIWPELEAVFAGRVVGAYNEAFDVRMLRQSCGLNGIPWSAPYAASFCVMELFAQYYGDWNSRRGSFRWKNLAFAGQFFSLPEPNSHRAKDDAYLTKLVLEKMAEG
ncbi:MAG TPA: 3'-5' exonuclease [Anaerolineales bacterium]|nr:3'-5' exonuclease [Anaerolineales bacterium]